jgi:hypothetical protein
MTPDEWLLRQYDEQAARGLATVKHTAGNYVRPMFELVLDATTYWSGEAAWPHPAHGHGLMGGQGWSDLFRAVNETARLDIDERKAA